MSSAARVASVVSELLALVFVSLFALSFVGLSPARAETDPSEAAASTGADPDARARDLLDRAYQNLYAEDYIQTLVLATQSRGGSEMRRRVQITRLQSERPGKALLRFLYPQAIRRTSVLILENEGASDDLYVFLPAVKLTRHLSNAQRADSFFGTDLSYEDVEPKHIEDFSVRALAPAEQVAIAAEAALAGCELIEVVGAPGFESAYQRQISCIEPERAIIIFTDFYIRDAVLKRLTVDPAEVRRVGERHVPWLITIETPRNRSITRVITEDYELRAKIPDRLFNSWNLEAGDADSDRSKTAAAHEAAIEDPAKREAAGPAKYEVGE